MGQVNIRKRGQVYQYQFETARVNGKRTQISKSGFKTKSEALLAGQKAQAEYISGESNSKESHMTYGNYLDFGMKTIARIIINIQHIKGIILHLII